MPVPLLAVSSGTTFTLKDVCNAIYTSCVVGNDSTYNGKSLSGCITDSVGGSFDSNYSGELGMKRFRNYGNVITMLTYNPNAKYNTVATGNGKITLIAGQTISSCGFCFNIIGTPTILDNLSLITPTPTVAGTYESHMSVSTGITYYVRMYVTNTLGVTVYGNQVEYTHTRVYNTVSCIQSGEIGEWTIHLQSQQPMKTDFNADVYVNGYINGEPDEHTIQLPIPYGASVGDPYTFDTNWDTNPAPSAYITTLYPEFDDFYYYY